MYGHGVLAGPTRNTTPVQKNCETTGKSYLVKVIDKGGGLCFILSEWATKNFVFTP